MYDAGDNLKIVICECYKAQYNLDETVWSDIEILQGLTSINTRLLLKREDVSNTELCLESNSRNILLLLIVSDIAYTSVHSTNNTLLLLWAQA